MDLSIAFLRIHPAMYYIRFEEDELYRGQIDSYFEQLDFRYGNKRYLNSELNWIGGSRCRVLWF